MNVQDLLDERACLTALVRYCSLIDDGHAAEVVELFSADGTWTLGETTLRGAGDLRRAFARRERMSSRTSRHVLSNVEIALKPASDGAPRLASGRAYLTAYRHDATAPDGGAAPVEPPVLVGDLRAEFAEEPDGWRITALATVPVFLRS
jgi:hypothetical protein